MKICAERMHRIAIAIVLGIIMGLVPGQIQAAFVLQLLLMLMLLVSGFTGFCPSLKILGQILPPCDDE
jgi:hypothetical protein